MTTVRIEAHDLFFRYGDRPVLRGLDLNVEAGELFAIVGPSGSGKTSLLRLLAGLETPNAGTVCINGMPVNDIPPGERRVGMVFQEFSLWPHLSVYENVVFGAPGESLRDGSARTRAEQLLATLGIENERNTAPSLLSGGQRQRAALARALIGDPRLLLLDDPFSNVEQELRVQMRRDLRLLQRKLALTTVFVTHDLDDAFSIADRIAVIDHGNIRQVGAPAMIHDFPNSTEVARFVGIENFISGQIASGDRQSVEFASADFGVLRWTMREPPPPGPTILGIRSSALCLCPADSFRDGRYAWFEGIVATSEFLGEAVRYRVAIGQVSLAVKQAHILGAPITPNGTAVLVGFDPAHARLFTGGDDAAIARGA